MSDANKPTQQRVEKVVFRGGGTKGIQLLGAIQALEAAGAWEDVREVWGSSAGGVAAMLAGLGMSADEITNIMNEIDFKAFMDKSTPFWSEALGIKNIDPLGFTDVSDKFVAILRALHSKQHGVFNGEVFADFAKMLITQKTGNPNITFAQLHDAATNPNSPIYDPRFKDICLTGSKINPPATLKLFNWRTTPDMPIWHAVRITMSFPGAFKAIQYDPSNNKILQPGNTCANAETLIDGGLKNNLPLAPAVKFTDDASQDPAFFAARSKHIRNDSKSGVIGVAMESLETIEAVHGFIPRKKTTNNSAINFVQNIAAAATGNFEVLKDFKEQIIMPCDLGQPTLNFTMDEATKTALAKEGRQAADDFCSARADFAQNYQTYHEAADIEHIVAKWRLLKALQEGLAKQELEVPLAGETGAFKEIDDIKAKYKHYNIEFAGDTEDYRQELAKIFAARQQSRQDAIAHANARQEASSKTTIIAQIKDNHASVAEIITNYEKEQRRYELLASYKEVITSLNTLINTELAKQTASPQDMQAIDLLKNTLDQLAQHKFASPADFTTALATASASMTQQIANLELNAEQVTNFTNVLKSYANHFNLHPEQGLPRLPAVAEIAKFNQQIQQQQQELELAFSAAKNNLRQLEIASYRHGMQILDPRTADSATTTNDNDCDIEQLKVKFNQAEANLQAAEQSTAIVAELRPRHFVRILNAKQEILTAINKNTGLMTKVADLLQKFTLTMPLYKVFHAVASLLPAIGYQTVNIMRDIRNELAFIQSKLESNPNIYNTDVQAKTYMQQIEEMTTKINLNKLTNVSASENKDAYKKLKIVLDQFNSYRSSKESEAKPTVLGLKPNSRQ